MSRRLLSLSLSGLLVIGAAAAVLIGHRGSSSSTTGGGSTGGSGGALTTVHGVIGSEKAPFFADADVQAAFAQHGYRLVVDTAGSREMVTTTDLSRYDFAFPAGAPQGEAIKQARHARATYVPFFTPMAIATFTPIVDILTAAGVVHRDAADGHPVLDVARYLAQVQQKKRWSDLPHNASYDVGKAVLISSTDVRTSNSAAMYLSLASYVANQDNVVATVAAADAATPAMSDLFLEQGFVPSSSEEPFTDYLSIGIGKEPMVMVYEAQFRGAEIGRNPAMTPDRQLMYPAPTVFSKHTLVPFNPAGDAVGQLLLTDPTLQHLAVRFGFRTGDAGYMQSFARQHGLQPLPALVDVVEPPTFDVLEHLITSIAKLYAARFQEASPS